MPDAARLIEAAHAVEIYNHCCAVHSARSDGTYLLDALKNGSFYASTGPELHAITLDSMDLNVECSAVMNIMAVGRASRSINDIGAALTKATLDVRKFTGDWFRVVLIDRAGRHAWSNPIWLEAS